MSLIPMAGCMGKAKASHKGSIHVGKWNQEEVAHHPG